MNEEEKIKRHKILHEHLDEIAAEFLRDTEKYLSETTIIELLEWSNRRIEDLTKILKT